MTRTGAHKAPPNAQQPRRSLRVMIVDDDRDTVLTLSALLRSEGHETKGVGTAAELWRIVDDFDPDVVLLDIGLPDRSGYEVARKLRERFGAPRPKLIAVTGWNKGSDKILAEIAGFDHHVGKPYDPNLLLALVAGGPPAGDAS
jgi:DNA-binding response OmpR family regulator